MAGGGSTSTDGIPEALMAYAPYIGVGMLLLVGAIFIFGRKGS